jgi:hypothetical protein
LDNGRTSSVVAKRLDCGRFTAALGACRAVESSCGFRPPESAAKADAAQTLRDDGGGRSF